MSTMRIMTARSAGALAMTKEELNEALRQDVAVLRIDMKHFRSTNGAHFSINANPEQKTADGNISEGDE